MKKGMIVLLAALLLALLCAIAGAEGDSMFLPLAEGENVVLPIDLKPGTEPKQACFGEDGTYVDSSLSVRIEEYTVNNTRCIAAFVRVADPSQLRTAPAYDFARDQVADTERMASRMKAVVAINGDYYSYWGATKGGYILRQGVLYKDSRIDGRDALLIDDKGDFTIVTRVTEERLKEALSGKTIINALNFGPGLIVDGVIVDKGYGAAFCQSNERHQRAAICQMAKGSNEYVFAVCEGEWIKRETGLTIREWAEFLQSLGVEEAYNLDGGNSTALIFNGVKLNEPGNPNHRQLSDIIYFASAAKDN